jgi:hypothetical protein
VRKLSLSGASRKPINSDHWTIDTRCKASDKVQILDNNKVTGIYWQYVCVAEHKTKASDVIGQVTGKRSDSPFCRHCAPLRYSSVSNFAKTT